jgi:hypothetical protein
MLIGCIGGGYCLKSATIYYGILKGRVFEVCAHLMLFPSIVKGDRFANFEYFISCIRHVSAFIESV